MMVLSSPDTASEHQVVGDASSVPLSDLLARHTPVVQKYANGYYGHQIRRSGQALSRTLTGKLETAQTTRWYQLNQVVTSGVTPRGTPSDFDSECHHLIQRVKRELPSCTAPTGDGEVGWFIARNPMPIREALTRAAELSARIRGKQTLLDGNHRTALLAFITALAESEVLVQPTFSIYRAYLILSARQHPGNVGNLLNDAAVSDVADALFRYSRTHVKPGTPDWPYLDTWAEQIRQLPVYNSIIEAEYRRLHVKTGVFDGGEEMVDLRHQMKEWKGLPANMRRDIALAHPTCQPGASH